MKVELTENEVEELSIDSNIQYIEANQTVQLAGEVIPSNLTQIKATPDSNRTGKGVKVALLDTGIDLESTELSVAGGASFISSEPTYDDLNGHGTHLAGVIAAADNDESIVGIAPNVELYALKVLNKDGVGTYGQVIEAIEWSIDNDIDIISMSFSSDQFSAILQDVMKEASDKGILLIAASGNDGMSAISYPAKYPSVMAVGAVDSLNQRADFSNYGEELEIMAPGVDVAGLSLDNGQYTTISGTSVAVPHVAGIAALIKEEHPSYSGEDIRTLIDSTALTLGEKLEYGYGLANLEGALSATFTRPARESSDATEEIKNKLLEEGLTEEQIQGFLDEGYTLDNLTEAISLRKKWEIPIEAALLKVKPELVNDSQKIEPEHKSDYSARALAVTENASVTAAATTPVEGLDKTKIKTDDAPYTVGLNYETVSTLSGSLSTSATDAYLPGRNGLGFSLTRSYDSGSSQRNNGKSTIRLGEGWSWDIPSVKEDRYVSIPGGGTYDTYKVSDGNLGSSDAEGNIELPLKNYPWKDLVFIKDPTTKTTKGYSAKYLLKNIVRKLNYFFDTEGHLIEIADAYNNAIVFGWSPYNPTVVFIGEERESLLTSITDSIGNSITISYSEDENKIVITQGQKVVTLNKTTVDGMEILESVTDPLGRKTTYEYNVKAAKDNLAGTTPNNDNAYALLTKVYHPTGAESLYTYESEPVTRFTSEKSVNQVYRLLSTSILMRYSDGSQDTVNLKTVSYTGDMGSVSNKTYSYTVIINNGLTQTTYENKIVYIDENNPTQYFNTKVSSVGAGIKQLTENTFDEAKRISTPISSTSKRIDLRTGKESEALTSSQTFDSYGYVLTATDAMGVKTTYIYDPETHWLKSVIKPTSETQAVLTYYTYNDVGSVISELVKDNKGNVLRHVKYEQYDSYGNPTTIKWFDGKKDVVSTTEYSEQYKGAYPTRQNIQVTDVDGKVTNIITSAEYDTTTGLLTKYTDGKKYSTIYVYDLLDRLTLVTFPTLNSLQINYDDDSNKTTAITETGIKTITSFNPIGWNVEAGIEEDGIYKAKFKYNYDSNGRKIAEEDALGNRVTFKYDAWNRLTKTTDASGAISIKKYDDLLNNVITTDATGNSMRQTSDKFGRVISTEEIKPSGVKMLSKVDYGYGDVVLQSSDALGNKTSFKYDALGQLTSVVNANWEETKYEYDLSGSLVKITHPDNNTVVKKYDELGRLLQKTNENGSTEKYYYDANNNLVKIIDKNGETQTFEYSSRNWLLKDIAVDETIEFTYYEDGKRKTMMDGTGVTNYQYNPFTGLLELVVYPDGKSIQYTHNTIGNRKSMIDPFGGSLIYQYDANNHLKSVGENEAVAEVKYDYYKNGQLQKATTRNGITTNYTYDGGVLDTITHKKADGSVLNAYDYNYDANRNIIQIIENESTSNYSYDVLNRIKTSSQYNETYEYDSRGNRTVQNSLHSFENTNSEYVYDKRNRLTKVTASNGNIVTYKYNGDNLMVERTENNITTKFYYDGKDIIAEGIVETNGSVSFKARYLRGTQLIALQDNSGKSYYLQNGHGDIVELRNNTGEVQLNKYKYDIWGNPSFEEEKVYNPFRYSGEMWDTSTSLQYLRARWYDPSEGRFINEDTYEGNLTNPLSLNLYSYVENNPLIKIDPTGHTSDGGVVGTLIDIAREKGVNSQSYWNIRGRLGAQAQKFFPDAMEDGNNQFKYLYDMATSSQSTPGQAEWAKQQLVAAFQFQYEYEQAEFEKYMSGLLVSLDLNISFNLSILSRSRPWSTVTLGMYGEIKLGEIVAGGVTNKYMKTSTGGRYIDVLSDGVAYESKVGFVKNNNDLAWSQLYKDAELLTTGQVDRVVWYFFRSPETGLIGADQRFLDALTKNNIEYIIYD
nr:S8 family serine peptidase [Paenibacillus phyllosphaerae]